MSAAVEIPLGHNRRIGTAMNSTAPPRFARACPQWDLEPAEEPQEKKASGRSRARCGPLCPFSSVLNFIKEF